MAEVSLETAKTRRDDLGLKLVFSSKFAELDTGNGEKVKDTLTSQRFVIENDEAHYRSKMLV